MLFLCTEGAIVFSFDKLTSLEGGSGGLPKNERKK